MAYGNIIKANMDALKKRDRKSVAKVAKKKAATAALTSTKQA